MQPRDLSSLVDILTAARLVQMFIAGIDRTTLAIASRAGLRWRSVFYFHSINSIPPICSRLHFGRTSVSLMTT